MSGVIGLDQQVKSGLFGFPSGHVIQIKHKQMTDKLTYAQTAAVFRTAVAGLFVDIRPSSTTSKIVVFGQLAMGFSGTPEWAWFIDREASNTSANSWVTQGASATADSMNESTRALLGTAGSRSGNQAFGYHGGPNDGNAASRTDDVFSYANVVEDTPGTTNICRYQINLQNLWSGTTTVYVNRSGNDANNGYATSGSCSITAMEVES